MQTSQSHSEHAETEESSRGDVYQEIDQELRPLLHFGTLLF